MPNPSDVQPPTPETRKSLPRLVVNDLEVSRNITVKTGQSVYVFEPQRQSDHGTIYGLVTRFSEVPMTTEGGTAYLPDVVIVQQECFLFGDTEVDPGDQMYFHGIRYGNRKYDDLDYDVIHTAPVDAFYIDDQTPVLA